MSLIRELGLRKTGTRASRHRGHPSHKQLASVYGTVQLTVLSRDCTCEVIEDVEGAGIVIGRVPLLALDLVVDPVRGRLIGNPEHGGEQMIELYSVIE
jgi:hypothetical protein